MTDQITEQLQRWAETERGPEATVGAVRPMPGHAGLSFGFEVRTGDRPDERLVVRLAPPGVRRRGNTDVLRQVPVLQAMDRAGVPVAPVVWSSDDPAIFGTDAYVQRFVEGAPLRFDEGRWTPGDGDPLPFLSSQIRALAQIHAVDWRAELAGWESPKELDAEIEHWRALQPKMAEEHTSVLADRLADALLASRPDAPDVGVFHGDFHPTNVLFRDDASVSAVVDWEICGIGAQLLDIAWLSMMLDGRCWDLPANRGLQGDVDSAWLLERYQAESGRDVSDAAWFKALSCYRFGVITGFNLRLHRTGKRDDPHWEDIGSSCAALLERGLHLLEHPGDF
ncbi:phosphotransferase family protein [Cumulibacter manganitolerans]|uniref:phosphotransferase family protein n=1 Tax=Cumulibacter manganitolerans TaxID=1884992 RepID=UPI0012950C21|nr:phosphotransferase family protein [Cumulibacter manganitolerans]